MKTLSALAAATAMTLALATGAVAGDVKPLVTTKSTQAEGTGAAATFGGLGVGATAGIVLASALLITLAIDDDNGPSTSTPVTPGS